MLLGTYEKAATPWSPKTDAVGFRPGPADARPRPHRAVAGGRLQAFPGARSKAGIRKVDQRPLHLLARRQSAGRAGAGPEEFLVRLRRHGGLQPGRRRRPGAVATGWSTAIPASTSGRMDVARFGDMGDARLHQRQGARELFAPLPHPLPERGAAGRAADADDGALRQDDRAGRGDGRFSWGLETPLWFAPKGVEPKDIVSFHRSNDFRACEGASAWRCARASASPRSPTSPNTRSPARAPRPSCRG